MAQPFWITPAGSLGTIPEGVFYQQSMLASVPPEPVQVTVTATTAGTNRLTCASTSQIQEGWSVMFTGSTFGGINDFTQYYVLEIVNSTQFTVTVINPYEITSTAVPLTTATGNMGTVFKQNIEYFVLAGNLPPGIQCNFNGVVAGVPKAVASFQGVPFEVSRDVTSKFVLRAFTANRVNGKEVITGISDRTFTITVTGNDTPTWITPAGSIGTYYDGGQVNYQFQYQDLDPDEIATVTVSSGTLPPGLTLSPTGLLSGYIQPASPYDQVPGYDITAINVDPYDFVTSYISRNYQFTLVVSDGKSQDIRNFSMFVYARNTLTADSTQLSTDNSIITADETTNRAPFLVNASPSDLGRIRSDNYYAYQFQGDDYDTENISYAISVNQGAGLPPGLELDPGTGWFYGDIPDQGTTEIEYSFAITVYQTEPVGDSVICTNTAAGTNIITCLDTSPLAPESEWYDPGTNPLPLYVPVKVSGNPLGGLSTAGNTLYWVLYVFDEFTFSITDSPNSTTPVNLTTASGTMTIDVVIASESYPFTLTIVGAVDSEITWLTPAELGTLVNGETSLLYVAAENRGGRDLQYRLAPGEFNSLPQGLQLLQSGDIAGRVTFNTFAVDLGDTTFDSNTTTWDSIFTFTVNAYAPDTQQILYNVSEISVVNGGTGYSSGSPPTIVFSTPVGASAVQAVVGNVTISGGVITAVEVSNPGAGYTGNAAITITEGFGGSGASLQAIMQATGTRDVVSVFKEFTIRVVREYNKPYQNLYVNAMPPERDRALINSLLSNRDIFVPDYIYRPSDPNFGLSTQVTYQHAFGLAPDTLDTYVESLYLNHYWKQLTLGSVQTAQARDSLGNIVYEVVYSKINDNLVNDQGQSVSKIKAIPYPIIDPNDGSTVIGVVYPNSLINMRDQVIDTVGQISTALPLWMTSKQQDGRVLGFTPAWVIAYVKPGRGAQVAYYLNTQFGEQLNKVDFKVDRYVLDRALSLHWDPEVQDWYPQPKLTTFDRFDTAGYTFIGNVTTATNLAFSDVNGRTLDYITALGGLDGQVPITDGDTIVFVKQENYNGPPGSSYSTTEQGWQYAEVLYDNGGYDASGQEFDESYTVSDGDEIECTATTSANGRITYLNAAEYPKVYQDLPLQLDDPIGGLNPGLYVALSSPTNTTFTVAKATYATSVEDSTDLITITDSTDFNINDPVVFYPSTFGGIVAGQTYYIKTITPTVAPAAQITLSLTPGGIKETFGAGAGSCVMRGPQLAVTDDAGLATARTFNERMAVWKISLDPITELVSLSIVDQTVVNDFVQVSQGTQYRSAQLYRPNVPGMDLTRISWLALVAVRTDETTFDQDSMQFIEPVDMYNAGQINDKYLVFPKTNILV